MRRRGDVHVGAIERRGDVLRHARRRLGRPSHGWDLGAVAPARGGGAHHVRGQALHAFGSHEPALGGSGVRPQHAILASTLVEKTLTPV